MLYILEGKRRSGITLAMRTDIVVYLQAGSKAWEMSTPFPMVDY